MRVVSKRFCDWSPAVKRRLRYATLRGDGHLREFASAFPTSMTTVIFSPGGQVMGWSFAHKHGNLPIDVNLFVNERYRGRGLGYILVRRALQDFKKIRLAEWDETTRYFFRKLLGQHPTRVEVFNWHKEAPRYALLVRESRRQAA